MYANLLKNRQFIVIFLCMILFVIYDSGNFYNNATSLMHSNSSLAVRLFKVFFLIPIAVISYYSVVCCIFSNSYLLRSLGALLFIGGVVNAFTFDVTGSFPNAGMLGVAIQERFFASSFITSHWKLIAYTILYSIAIFVLIAVVKVKFSLSFCNKVAGAVLLSATVANVFLSNYTGGRRPALFGYNVIIESTKAIVAADIPYTRRAYVNSIECSQCPDILFYIIDESITYEALVAIKSLILQNDIVESKLGASAFAFKAYSAGNHSSVSNYILRLGVGKSSYPDSKYKTVEFPNIFSYAKASHYKTVFYDAQVEDKRLQNFMSQYDLSDIDYFITANASSDRYNLDMLALERLRQWIDEAGPDNRIAIVLVKNGVHFPYVNSVPPSLIHQLPEGCRSPDVSFSSQQIFCKKAQYEIALKFSVDQFMDKLFSLLAGKNFALIYTSDHGQNLSSKYSLAHGSTENTSECEISVPILIAGTIFSNTVQKNGIRSHFQIPPTLLSILGHASQDQARGTTLRDEWRGGSDFLHDPFEPAGQWYQPIENCTYDVAN